MQYGQLRGLSFVIEGAPFDETGFEICGRLNPWTYGKVHFRSQDGRAVSTHHSLPIVAKAHADVATDGLDLRC